MVQEYFCRDLKGAGERITEEREQLRTTVWLNECSQSLANQVSATNLTGNFAESDDPW
jgi:hypothetical protein